MLISPTINSLNGRIFLHAGADPAAGAEIFIEVPARKRWRILGLRFTLVTDATVADRRVRLAMDDGTNSFLLLPAVNTQAASLSHAYSYANFGHAQVLSNTNHAISLPPYLLPAGSQIETSTILIKAGDNFGIPYLLVEEWIDP